MENKKYTFRVIVQDDVRHTEITATSEEEARDLLYIQWDKDNLPPIENPQHQITLEKVE